MIAQENFNRLVAALPILRQAGPALAQEFMQKAFLTRLPAGRDVFVEGDSADTIALLLSGVVRVYKIGATGREITLYRFGLGESCILTANAILSRQTFPAIATVEKEAEAALIAADDFRDWVRKYDLWRTFVFDLLSQRLTAVMDIVEEVAFRRMDARLASFLLERSQRQNPVRITHQEVAAELGSSREVISRILEDFAALGVIDSRRGTIEVVDPASLRNRAFR
jgi:CRP/FNR family transcriptional regulator